ncbi:class I SAM-dependent methyltransferase [Thermogemmatispora tikiterensis]|uniref:Methyltransferase domain-containing protein n=1 Tax=Thermogemmatispora tikiterensis TaxID=1825093 RepID=A0A328VI19_9CHLR|nr:class I SAM-dependent methyltransferase [Thermogemmatispora tikiterensis]RAQ93935.1 hypothetical protein A4R35_00220 [Thermogemmatispora tikiterensis]
MTSAQVPDEEHTGILPSPRGRRRISVSIQERSARVGDTIIIDGHLAHLESLMRRMSEGGYQWEETPHFLLFRRDRPPKTIVVHRFGPGVSPEAMLHAIETELTPFGFLMLEEDANRLLEGIQASLDPLPVRLYQRSLQIGGWTVMQAIGLDRHWLARRYRQRGYQVEITPHFLVCTRQHPPSPVLLHWCRPEQMHPSLAGYLIDELGPHGWLSDHQQLSCLMTAIVGTTYPGDLRRAWSYFGANTLLHLLTLVTTAAPHMPPDSSTLEFTATLYQRVLELCAGKRFLDAGCNAGFFALLLAERRPFVEEIVGLDLDGSVFRVAEELARQRGLHTVRFVQGDLRSAELVRLGHFDTVTALHVLEHFAEAEMYQVLEHLLQVTCQHLILAVPYEEQPTAGYGHRQCFSPERLQQVGQWCLEQLQGAGQLWYEEVARGGLLLIERTAP